MRWRGGVGVHCGPHVRGPVPHCCRRPRALALAREDGGTGGAQVHERGAHSKLLRTPHLVPVKYTWAEVADSSCPCVAGGSSPAP